MPGTRVMGRWADVPPGSVADPVPGNTGLGAMLRVATLFTMVTRIWLAVPMMDVMPFCDNFAKITVLVPTVTT